MGTYGYRLWEILETLSEGSSETLSEVLQKAARILYGVRSTRRPVGEIELVWWRVLGGIEREFMGERYLIGRIVLY